MNPIQAIVLSISLAVSSAVRVADSEDVSLNVSETNHDNHGAEAFDVCCCKTEVIDSMPPSITYGRENYVKGSFKIERVHHQTIKFTYQATPRHGGDPKVYGPFEKDAGVALPKCPEKSRNIFKVCTYEEPSAFGSGLAPNGMSICATNCVKRQMMCGLSSARTKTDDFDLCTSKGTEAGACHQ